jgi:hypothetical protein
VWKEFAQRNRESIAAYKKTIRERENARRRTPEYRSYINAHRRNKKRLDPAWAMADRLRKRIGRALRDRAGIGAKKAYKTSQYLGCTIQELMAHLSSRFLPGMTWNNRHLWHVDHIIPCANFDLADPEQQKKCFHYTNLQPLWAKDNLEKRDKVA